MKVISGILKGKNIDIQKSINYRPTLSRIREDIFNILLHSPKINIDLKNDIFGDISCGSGSIGIEALSRGFKHCYFNDINEKSLQIITNFLKNFNNLSFECHNEDIENMNNKIKWELFDIIYFDPPYEMDVEKIIKQNIFSIKDNTILIIESNKNIFKKIEELFLKKYKNKYIKIYSSKKIKKFLNV
ncbi:MAG: hypothetical protein CMI90_00780 [Pelagibacteraceae bacterium]|nr:hypothetical protein [Pelagibacteraceae bacterium]